MDLVKGCNTVWTMYGAGGEVTGDVGGGGRPSQSVGSPHLFAPPPLVLHPFAPPPPRSFITTYLVTYCSQWTTLLLPSHPLCPHPLP